jgi:hypothetical protein
VHYTLYRSRSTSQFVVDVIDLASGKALGNFLTPATTPRDFRRPIVGAPDFMYLTTQFVPPALLPKADVQGQGLPTKADILAVSQAVAHTPSFSSDLFGDDNFVIWPTMAATMVATTDVNPANGWVLERTYVRVEAGRFASSQDEAQGNWTEFAPTDPNDLSPSRWIWRNVATGRLALIEGSPQSGGGSTSSSGLGASDGHFLAAGEAFETFQIRQFYNAPDLGDFFDTCIPMKKGVVEYIVCRDLTQAPRALQKVRYEVWARMSNSAQFDFFNVGGQVVAQIEQGLVPSELVPSVD